MARRERSLERFKNLSTPAALVLVVLLVVSPLSRQVPQFEVSADTLLIDQPFRQSWRVAFEPHLPERRARSRRGR